MSKQEKQMKELRIREKKDPKEMLKGLYNRILFLQKEIGRLDAQMSIVIEMQDWTPAEANEILGADVVFDAQDQQVPVDQNK